MGPSDADSVDSLGGGQPLSGVAVAEVLSNIDPTNQGRVQLRLPWLPWMPGVERWGRVASGSGGPGYGIYFIPQVGDEVLVAFHHGDVREVYVIGSLWSTRHAPPANSPLDPVNKRVIRTPAGHEIVLDDLDESVAVTSATGHTVRLEPSKVAVATRGGSATVVLEASGAVSVTAAVSIELNAPTVTLDAATLELKGSGMAKLTAGGVCQIQGGMVTINGRRARHPRFLRCRPRPNSSAPTSAAARPSRRGSPAGTWPPPPPRRTSSRPSASSWRPPPASGSCGRSSASASAGWRSAR